MKIGVLEYKGGGDKGAVSPNNNGCEASGPIVVSESCKLTKITLLVISSLAGHFYNYY